MKSTFWKSKFNKLKNIKVDHLMSATSTEITEVFLKYLEKNPIDLETFMIWFKKCNKSEEIKKIFNLHQEIFTDTILVDTIIEKNRTAFRFFPEWILPNFKTEYESKVKWAKEDFLKYFKNEDTKHYYKNIDRYFDWNLADEELKEIVLEDIDCCKLALIHTHNFSALKPFLKWSWWELDAIKLNPDNIQYLYYKSRTKEMLEIAIKHNAINIMYLPRSLDDDWHFWKIASEAPNAGKALRYICQNTRWEFITDEIILSCLKQGWSFWQHDIGRRFSKSKITEEMIYLSAKNDIASIANIPPESFTKEIIKKLVTDFPSSFEHIKPQFRNKDITYLAVWKLWNQIQFAQNRFKNKDLCTLAMNNDTSAFKYCPDKYQTKEALLSCLDRLNSLTIRDIPENLKLDTEILAKMLITKKIYSYDWLPKFVKDFPDLNILEALLSMKPKQRSLFYTKEIRNIMTFDDWKRLIIEDEEFVNTLLFPETRWAYWKEAISLTMLERKELLTLSHELFLKTDKKDFLYQWMDLDIDRFDIIFWKIFKLKVKSERLDFIKYDYTNWWVLWFKEIFSSFKNFYAQIYWPNSNILLNALNYSKRILTNSNKNDVFEILKMIFDETKEINTFNRKSNTIDEFITYDLFKSYGSSIVKKKLIEVMFWKEALQKILKENVVNF